MLTQTGPGIQGRSWYCNTNPNGMNADSKAAVGTWLAQWAFARKLPSDSRQHPAVVINSEGNSSRNTGQSIRECPRQPTKAAERMSLLGMPGSLVAYDFTSAKGAFLCNYACMKLRQSGLQSQHVLNLQVGPKDST